MADCVSPAQIADFASKDTLRIQGRIAEAVAVNAPFVNILNGGTFDAGVSDEVRSVVEEQAAPDDSLTIPTFVNDTATCQTVGGIEDVGTTEYVYRLQTKRGRGPKVCVKQAYAAFKTSYIRAEDALKKLVVQYMNADVRGQLYLQSGVKMTIATGYSFDSLISGGYQQIGVNFPNIQPNAMLNFTTLSKLSRFLTDVMLAEKTGSGKDMHFKFIGSSDQIEFFRNELGVKQDLIGLTTGGFKLGEESITGYTWEGPYRGIAMGIDQRPLRASSVVNGVPQLVQPLIKVPTTKGMAGRPNPAWINAPFEISFLIAEGSFERLIPESYTGEGTFKFSPQLNMGELKWHYQEDNDCNIWGDTGFHKYQITRAYRPVRPHWVIPILHARCQLDLGLVQCSGSQFSSI